MIVRGARIVTIAILTPNNEQLNFLGTYYLVASMDELSAATKKL